ncbi:unnamed protein product [Boreogadus saida]
MLKDTLFALFRYREDMYTYTLCPFNQVSQTSDAGTEFLLGLVGWLVVGGGLNFMAKDYILAFEEPRPPPLPHHGIVGVALDCIKMAAWP